jgi:hypothetical protein
VFVCLGGGVSLGFLDFLRLVLILGGLCLGVEVAPFFWGQQIAGRYFSIFGILCLCV